MMQAVDDIAVTHTNPDRVSGFTTRRFLLHSNFETAKVKRNEDSSTASRTDTPRTINDLKDRNDTAGNFPTTSK